jgi:hypothetical protein
MLSRCKGDDYYDSSSDLYIDDNLKIVPYYLSILMGSLLFVILILFFKLQTIYIFTPLLLLPLFNLYWKYFSQNEFSITSFNMVGTLTLILCAYFYNTLAG